MPEYIERAKAQDGLDNIDWYHVNDKGQLLPGGKSDIETYVPFKAVEEMLKSIPAAVVRPVKWTLCEEKQPPQGRYLCVKQLFNGDFSYDVCSFAEDLSKVDKYDFPKNIYKGIGGWFDYDSETGYFQTGVYAWIPLPPFYNCGADMREET